MGRFNSFWGILECPACHVEERIEIQAEVGLVQWDFFELGNPIWGRPVESNGSFISPEDGLEDSSFWAHGIGMCPQCRVTLYARIEIQKGIFVKLAVAPSPNESDSSDFLGRWGLIE